MMPRVRSAAYGQATPSWDPTRRMDRTWADHFAALGYLPGPLPEAPVPAELQCPAARGFENDASWAGYMPHYGYNVFISPPESMEATLGERSFRGRPALTAVSASATILLADSRHVDVARGWHAMGNQHWVDVRHAGAANVAYVDGSQRLQRPAYAAPESTLDRGHPFSQVFFARQAGGGGGSW
jgi:prepilin-type processing-associated H-X9-DG protein